MLGLWATSASPGLRKTLSSTWIWTGLSHSTPDLLPALGIYTTENGKQTYITPSLSPSKLLQKRFTQTYESKGVFYKTQGKQYPIRTHSPASSVKIRARSAMPRHSLLPARERECFFLAFILIKSLASWGVFSLLVIGDWDYRKPLNQPPLFTKDLGALPNCRGGMLSADHVNHSGCIASNPLIHQYRFPFCCCLNVV